MTVNDPIDFAEFTSINGWEKFQQDYFSVMAISEAVEVKSSAELFEDNLNGHTIKPKTNTEAMFAIADLESPMSILNTKTDSDYRKSTNRQYLNISPGRHGKKISTLQR